jgi:hypothetical protein
MSTAIRRPPRPAERARVTRPKPGKTSPARRIRQRTPGRYNPRIASRGLTRDTTLGPVDLVAIERALAGRGPLTLTRAEYAELIERLAMRPLATRHNGEMRIRREAAEAIGANPATLTDDVCARRAQLREAGLYPHDEPERRYG